MLLLELALRRLELLLVHEVPLHGLESLHLRLELGGLREWRGVLACAHRDPEKGLRILFHFSHRIARLLLRDEVGSTGRWER